MKKLICLTKFTELIQLVILLHKGIRFFFFSSNIKKSEGMNCAICLTNEINTIILPCNHMCICNECCEDLKTKSKKCPICRKSKFDLK